MRVRRGPGVIAMCRTRHRMAMPVPSECARLASLRSSAIDTANQVIGATPGGATQNSPIFYSGAQGLQYVGFHAGSIGPSPSSYAAYGWWYRYGIDTHEGT